MNLEQIYITNDYRLNNLKYNLNQVNCQFQKTQISEFELKKTPKHTITLH